MDLQALADKIEIQEVLARYSRGVDTKDWDLWRTVFTPDAFIDYRAASSSDTSFGTRDEMGVWLQNSVGTLPMTQHYITNVEIDLDGDTARVLAMFFNPMRLPGTAGLSYCGGFYNHEMVRTDEGWKSRKLVEENVWFEAAAAAAS
ncbi:SnoaL-like domain-containing protein [Frankia sp. EI5c]|uniref:nuclear transport factor 2 family protein n=1 Tax=Frankia sp. EI5c TaxID=683316 RepID=UPI0007C30D64|nr:nuclear transport factor 2 family protein [Frankia sp. EI5c]OAA26839.1 SnoaL-like domain-containing protein [Frankia sp. EI5c]